MTKRFLPLAVFTALLAFATSLSPAEARTRALLVGVADYNEASGIRDLLGPRNDVTIMWRLLRSRGVAPEDMTVLTDGLPDGPEFPKISGPATYGNIIAGFDALARDSGDKDDVVFYYSGHGTRQPDNDPAAEDEPEADGYDQVLLPADTGPYDPTGGGIKNSLVDDELGRKLDAIRAKGAFVWAIINSCHSGTVTRGDEVTRSVDPDLLHVPPAQVTGNASRGGERKGTLKFETKADLVGFYAVDAFDEAIERPFTGYNMPMVGEGKKQRMGVFTYVMHKALSRGTAVSYADLAREISADLATDRSGGRVPQPVFDGELDHVILGTNSSEPRLVSGTMSAGEKLTIPDAGILHNFDEGARVAIYAPGNSDEPIGRAEIVSAGPSSSEAGNIIWEPGADKIKDGAVQVKVTEGSVSFRFAVSPPPASDIPAGADGEAVSKAIELAFGGGSGSREIGIEMGEAGSADGDVLLRVANGRLWIVRPDRAWDEKAGSFGETPSIAIGSDPQALAVRTKQAVWLLARAAKLVRLGGSLGESLGGVSGLAIKAELQRGGAPKGPSSGCDKPNKDDASQPLAAYTPQGVGNCDVVRLHVTNQSDFTYYIAGFYVDALGGVQTLSPRDKERGCVRTLYSGTGGEVTYTIQINTWDTANSKPAAIGVENAVILAIPQDQTKIAPRMCSLVQPTLAEMQATRGVEETTATRGPGRALKNLLGGVTGSATRAASVGGEEDEGGPKVGGSLFVFDVRP